ncbi:MAG: hypothetical protein ACREXW_20620 [Gammaproteobacteria bacterium]
MTKISPIRPDGAPPALWGPLPWRPVMLNGYERQFVYVYGAVSPLQGDFDWMLGGEMNTLRMGEFLGQVSRAHLDDFMVMIVDGAMGLARTEPKIWPYLKISGCRPCFYHVAFSFARPSPRARGARRKKR